MKNKNAVEKSSKGTLLTLKIDGMHCSSCSMNIDGDLEVLDGVISATTSYKKQESKIEYDGSKVDEAQIRKVIENLGYKVS
ncbi:heavy-metal-associated domain-containing protein [Candidatus Pacearchaeota archaeon]|nr:heavy-metal-associated domain-containing protein [Candidatus Pacearchaeota archaeon]